MKTTDILHAELEELQKKYWRCFNNWECEEDLQRIYCQIEELKHRLSIGKPAEVHELRQVV